MGREGKRGGVEGYIPMLNMGHGIMNEFYIKALNVFYIFKILNVYL